MKISRRDFSRGLLAAGVAPGWLALLLEPVTGRAEPVATDIPLADVVPYTGGATGRWWKGNLHTHTYRSDGKAFPEEAAALYRREGFHFFGFSDHNVGQEDLHVSPIMKSGLRSGSLLPTGCVKKEFRERFEKAFPNLALPVEKAADGTECFRLRKFDEMGKLLNEKDRFLLISGNELTFTGYGDNFHACVVNTRGDCLAKPGHANDAAAVDDLLAQAALLGEGGPRDRLFTLNHPHWYWFDLLPKLAIDRPSIRFFEISNQSSGNELPPPEHQQTIDGWWDAVNTARALRGQPLLYGMGSDDTHDYTPFYTHKGLGNSYCMVLAPHLTREELFRAFYRGDFYASTGVELESVTFDPAARKLSVKVKPRPGETYVIRFIGSRKGVKPDPVKTYSVKPPDSWLKSQKGWRGNLWRGGKVRTVEVYEPGMGATFAETEGTEATYAMRPDDLYVRCKVFVKNDGHLEDFTPPRCPTAWTQPIAGAK